LFAQVHCGGLLTQWLLFVKKRAVGGCPIKNKNIIEEIIIFFLIVNFYCASRSVNLRGKAPFQMSKQAGLRITNFGDSRKNG
jgi:hypothetical protein